MPHQVMTVAPHTATVDITLAVLSTAMHALAAEFPGIGDEPHPWRPAPPDQFAARGLLMKMRAFERVIDRYRASVVRQMELKAIATDGDKES